MAANRSRVVWVNPPANMARALDQYGDRVYAAIFAVCEFVAAKMQGEARVNAPWADRTGNARTGLFAVAVRKEASKIVEIYLSHGHTIKYGLHLETSHGGRWGIINKVIEQNLPEIKRLLDGIFR